MHTRSGMTCVDCGKPVEPVAAALATKIVSPHATEFRCLNCLAKVFATSRERLLDAARAYRDRGCLRFRGINF
jgi:DNA-directed RNA polymerase subunit RPC12/RpoP